MAQASSGFRIWWQLIAKDRKSAINNVTLNLVVARSALRTQLSSFGPFSARYVEESGPCIKTSARSDDTRDRRKSTCSKNSVLIIANFKATINWLYEGIHRKNHNQP
jgi:hypothetical protein